MKPETSANAATTTFAKDEEETPLLTTHYAVKSVKFALAKH